MLSGNLSSSGLNIKDISSINVNSITSGELTKYTEIIISGVISYFPRILGSLIIIWVGFKIVEIIEVGIEKLMQKQKFEPMLKGFLASLLNGILKILVIITAAGILGIETSSFVAMVAAAGLAVGLALKGTLQNFAGGVMILLLKPFRIGHLVEISSFVGEVKDIHIFNTLLLTPDNKRIIIPNSNIISSPIVNYSIEGKRRVDLVIGISYNDDIDKAKKLLSEIVTSDERIISEDEIIIGVRELGANSVNIDFRFFVKSDDYWDVYRAILESVKKTFDREGVHFPYPQRDVHLYKH